jgi:hypothetical protein
MGGSSALGAVQGIQAWMGAFDRSAASVTGAAAQLSSDAVDQADSGSAMIDGMVGMNTAAAGVKANIAVFRTTDEMLGMLLDMRA